MNTNKN